MLDIRHELRHVTSRSRGGDPTRWDRSDPECGLAGNRSVYVIQLSDWPNRSSLGSLYVGQTSQTVQARFDQHQSGDGGAKGLAGHCRRLRPELYLDLPLFPSDDEAVEAEWARASRLRAAGFAVECNNARYSAPGRHHRDPFTSEDLGGLPTRLQREIVVSMDVPVASDAQVIDALRWCADPDCGDLPADMFRSEWVGRLAHVDESAVAELVRHLRNRSHDAARA